MTCCPSCAQGVPCREAVVGGFLFCDIDSTAFYAQKVPLFPDKYQRWVIAMKKPSGKIGPDTIRNSIVTWLQNVGSKAGLKSSGVFANIRAVKVLSVGDIKPNSEKLKATTGIVKVVTPLPPFHENPLSNTERTDMLYIVIEFFYDGSSTSGDWPWFSRGILITCPEDAFSGLIAVMRPVQALAPPTLIEELERPLIDAAIALDEATKPMIKTMKKFWEEEVEKGKEEVFGALKFLMWGGAAVLLFNLFQATRSRRTNPSLPKANI